jgi:hypothetical protein
VWWQNGEILHHQTTEVTLKGIHYSNITMVSSGFSNSTTMSCSLANRRYQTTAKVYVIDFSKLNAMRYLSPIYPANEATPVMICWTPPTLFYTMVRISGYHISLLGLNSRKSAQETLVGKERRCWQIDSLWNESIELSIAAKYTAGRGVVRKLLLNLPKGPYNDKHVWNITVKIRTWKSIFNLQHYGIIIKWKLSYQWQPKYYHINLQCTNVTVTQAVIRDAEEYTVYDNSLIQNESCSVSISACLKDGQGGSCQWAVNSDVHNVTLPTITPSPSELAPKEPIVTTDISAGVSGDTIIAVLAAVVGICGCLILTILIAVGVWIVWKRRRVYKGSVFGVPSIRYNAYGDGGTTTIEPEDEHRLAEDAGYIAMTSENRKEIFDLKVNSLKCEESAYAEIPAAMVK